MLRNKQYYKVCRRGWHLHTDTNHMHTHTYMVWFSYKVTNMQESLMRNLHASREYTQEYWPVEELRGLKLVPDVNY